GISFVTPFGPIKLTYAKPIKKGKYDEQQRFLFGFSSSF
ncbi:MAG: BamA/TamA family outer membrane protein, partial [Alphaproteobacteria bacterium]|nr:BamA/TamA family outer membrane protein [Alphaproteobacteria bacterium]